LITFHVNFFAGFLLLVTCIGISSSPIAAPLSYWLTYLSC